MKKVLVCLAVAFALTGCTSFEYTTVSAGDIATQGGDAMMVMQSSAIGLTAIFHIIDIVPADLDVSINKVLITEAKALGASKVQLLSATTTPKHGIFALYGTIVGFPTSTAVGIAVK